MPRSPSDPIERIWARTQIGEPSECWPWMGALSTKGMNYGLVSVNLAPGINRKRYVHRLVYEAMVGLIPRGMEIDHTCRNTRCVNPAHLRLATRRENALNQEKVLRATCRNGHLRTEENVYIAPNGRRDCRICGRERKRRAA